MNMATFKKKLIGGVERIFKDNKVIMDEAELATIPAVVRRLDIGDSIEFDDQAPLPPEQPIDPAQSETKLVAPLSVERVSIISGEPATRRRFLNGIEYWLTDEEYNKYNLGKLAQAIREKSETVDTIQD